MALLNERVDVWRPVDAEREDDFYRIVGSVPENETWVFAPGSVVRCEQQHFSDGPALVAVEVV